MHHNSVTNDTHFNGLPINTGYNGEFYCYEIILQAILERLIWMTTKHCRVLPIRFDLRFPSNYLNKEDKNKISHFFKIMKENARERGKRQGINYDFHYVWVREQKTSEHCHFHCLVLLNGSAVQNYRRFIGEAERVWGHVLGCDAKHRVWACDRDENGFQVRNGVMLESPKLAACGTDLIAQNLQYNLAIEKLFYRASYLAKVNDKHRTQSMQNLFNASQLR